MGSYVSMIMTMIDACDVWVQVVVTGGRAFDADGAFANAYLYVYESFIPTVFLRAHIYFLRRAALNDMTSKSARYVFLEIHFLYVYLSPLIVVFFV